jgi:hypothetical protein
VCVCVCVCVCVRVFVRVLRVRALSSEHYRPVAYLVAHGTLERAGTAVRQRVSIQISIVAEHLATRWALWNRQHMHTSARERKRCTSLPC